MEIKDLHLIFESLGKYAKLNDLYWDSNVFSTSETRTILDEINTDISKDSDKGVKLRVWDGEKFLEYGTTSFEREEIEKNFNNLVNKAVKNKDDIRERFDLSIDSSEVKKEFLPEFKGENILTLEKKVEKLQELKSKVMKLPDVVNVRVGLIEEIEKHLFVNEFKNLYQEIPRVILLCIAYVKANDGSVKMVYEAFTNENYDVFKKCEDKLEGFKEKVHNIKSSKKLKGGKYKVLLSPTLSGLLAHESFGHGMEADTMMKGRALASSWIGRQIGGKGVSIVDYPDIKGKNGHFYFDHEGNLATKTYLVKEGVINEPMADLYSKSKLGLINSSNSRFETFDHKHYTRMSNTYFESGDETFDGLLKSIDNGIFVFDSHGGMEDPKGWGVQIQGCTGQKIENGKLVDEFYDGFTLTGFLPDIVKNISGISKEWEIDGAGSCGKGHKEWVRVSEGGPYLKIEEVILG